MALAHACCARMVLRSSPSSSRRSQKGIARFFIFTFFKKKITEIYFGFQNLQFYTPTARQGGDRGPTAPLLSGRDLFANKNKIYLRINPWWGPAAPLLGGRPPTAKWWGGRYLHLGYAPENFLVEYTCKE